MYIPALTGLLLKRVVPEKWGGTGVWNLSHTCNSLLSGLVAITAGCATVEPYGAVAIGCLAAPTYAAASCLMRRLRIDDPLDAFAVHGANGILGIVLVGFFTTAATPSRASMGFTPSFGPSATAAWSVSWLVLKTHGGCIKSP